MSNALGYIKTMLIRGVLFLFPLAIIVLLIGKVFGFANEVLAPIVKRLPQVSALGADFPRLASALLLLVICFVVGLLVSTRWGRALSDTLENRVLNMIPGYPLIKGMLAGGAGVESDANRATAVIALVDGWQIGYEMGRLENGYHVVFIPSVPTPMVGSLFFLEPERVKALDTSLPKAMRCVLRLGAGAKELVGKTL